VSTGNVRPNHLFKEFLHRIRMVASGLAVIQMAATGLRSFKNRRAQDQCFGLGASPTGS